MEHILLGVLIGIITLQKAESIYTRWQQAKERQDLYNRIQAGSLEAYVKGAHSSPDPDKPLAAGNRIKSVMDSQYALKRGERP